MTRTALAILRTNPSVAVHLPAATSPTGDNQVLVELCTFGLDRNPPLPLVFATCDRLIGLRSMVLVKAKGSKASVLSTRRAASRSGGKMSHRSVFRNPLEDCGSTAADRSNRWRLAVLSVAPDEDDLSSDDE